jgi:glycerol-3-phosphate O-acyltransferase
MLDEDKERVIEEVVHRMMERYGDRPATVERVLFDTIYEEHNRLEAARDTKNAGALLPYFNRMNSEAARAGPDRRRELLGELARHFAEEVAGHYDQRVYELATRIVPRFFTVLLNTLSPLKLLQAVAGGLDSLEDQLVLQGQIETFEKLDRLGTTVVISTHQSNLDSVVMGWALYRMGFPAFTYGAGANLFENKIMGFFMNNLGAYRVDRRIKADFYKEVLKTYAGCTMELGYHNMFFPGGTRSRSGAVERKLKMGLLGMALDAYIHNLAAGREKPDIFIIPCTMNYQVILEAETLIEDFLKAVGKNRYIITDDEFSQPMVVLEFMKKLFSLNSRIYFTVCQPLDVFGNRVDGEGRSLDRRGRFIDRTRYVVSDGGPVTDSQRDVEYTRELTRSVIDEFHRNTVINPTNLLAYAMFEYLRELSPDLDIYHLLLEDRQVSVPLPTAYDRVDRALNAVRDLSNRGRLRLDETVARKDIVMIVNVALAHFESFHRGPALTRRGDHLDLRDRKLLFYYHNRLVGFEVGDGGRIHEQER